MRLYTRHLFVLLLCLCAATAARALTASFTATPTSGCPPLLVNFTNTSTGYTSYSWDLGNGTPPITTVTNPGGTYVSPGTYTVTLTVYSGSTSATATQVITVYPLPNTNFYALDTTVCPCGTVSFVNTTTGSGGPFTYTWNFGDGTTSTMSSPTHNYCTPGYYNVTLSATNAQGCTKTITKTAYIQVYNPPVASFTSSTTSICNPPGTVTFASTTTGAAPFSTLWDFGDGSPVSATGVHVYSSPGSYTVKLYVTDANGCADTIVQPAYLTVMNLSAAFTGPAAACAGSLVSWVNTSPSFTGQSWTFGDGSPASPIGSHSYSSPGTYTVTLTITNGPCSATISHTITIWPTPAISFVVNPTAPCPPPATLTVTATAPAGSTLTWGWSDGSPTSTGTSTTHTYPAAGVYTISVGVVDANGCVNGTQQVVTLYDLYAGLTALPTSGCVPLTVTFTPSVFTLIPTGSAAAYPYGPASYTWGFGDGGTGGATPGGTTHTYTAVGTYVATVTATTANGCIVTNTIPINVGAPPVATFSAAPTHICYGDSVVFTATMISGPIDNYLWIFGDGGTGSGASPTYTYYYTIPGTFTVKLVPFYHGCKGDTVTITNYVTVDSPKAILTAVYNCINKRSVTFTNSSMGATSYLWDFGDATPLVTGTPVTHVYPALGFYNARIFTYNAASGCRDTATLGVGLIDLNPDFVGDALNICKYGTVNFTASVAGGTPSHYYWYVNGVLQTLYNDLPNMSRWFNVAGLYTVMLVTQDAHGCYDTMNKVNYIRVAKPAVAFTAAPTAACWGVPVIFTDASTDVSGATIVSHDWDFGDGGSVSGPGNPVSHTYSVGGTYTITEIVTDNYGCKDTLVRPSYVTVHRPVPAFYATTTTPCVNVPVTFVNTSTGASTSLWRFGDGGTSTTASPTHTYTSAGLYTVKLIVTDAFGCTDSVTQVGYLNVTRPSAAFTMSDSFSVCPPLTVNFTNGSSGATAYDWAFGDGNVSVGTSPTNMYISAGYYNVRLIAINSFGCRDTAIRHVNVYGYAGAFSYAPLSGCKPLRVFFNATVTNVTSMTWDFTDGVVVTGTADTISHVYNIPGAYVPKLLLSDNTGCQNSSVGIDTIKVDGVIPKFVTEPNPVCENTPFTFIDSSRTYWSPITSLTWRYDGNVTTSTSPTYTFPTAGTYTASLTVVNGWGCTDSVKGTINVYPPPVITASGDTTVCVSDPATLYGSGGVSYTWAPPATLSCTACNPTMATPTVESVYTVTGTDEHGCSNTDTVRVKLRTHTIANAWGDTAVCRGVPVPLFDTGGSKYTWQPGWLSSQVAWNPTASPPSSQTYTVIAQLASCIPDTNYVHVTIYQLPTVDAGPDQRLLAGSTAQLEATGSMIHSLMWTPTTSCDTCARTTSVMEQSRTFYIDVLSDHGCHASDSVRILIFCDNSQIFIPNSFTPNGDGENDVFYPRGKGVKAVKSFRIFNRWGEQVYERDGLTLNDPTMGWDGSYKGEVPRPDVYVYFLEAICYTGEPIFIKGDVTILR